MRRLNNNGGDKRALSHNFSNLKVESIWSLTLGDDNKKITGGTYTTFWTYQRDCAHQRSGGT